MSREPDTAEQEDDATAETPESDTGGTTFDRELLSDLSVNVVPIAIIVAFVLVFTLLPPVGEGGDPLLLFHSALIVGVVLVSIVAGWVISRQDGPLEGNAARNRDSDSDRE